MLAVLASTTLLQHCLRPSDHREACVLAIAGRAVTGCHGSLALCVEAIQAVL